MTSALHPQTISVVRTRLEALGLQALVVDDVAATDFTQRDVAGILLQYPDTFGDVSDYSALAEEAHANGVGILYFISDIRK